MRLLFTISLALCTLLACDKEEEAFMCDVAVDTTRLSTDLECAVLPGMRGNFNSRDNVEAATNYTLEDSLWLSAEGLRPYEQVVNAGDAVFAAEAILVVKDLAEFNFDSVFYFFNSAVDSSLNEAPTYAYRQGVLGNLQGDTLTLIGNGEDLLPKFAETVQQEMYAVEVQFFGTRSQEFCFELLPCVRY